MWPGKLSLAQKFSLENLKADIWEIGSCGNKKYNKSGKCEPVPVSASRVLQFSAAEMPHQQGAGLSWGAGGLGRAPREIVWMNGVMCDKLVLEAVPYSRFPLNECVNQYLTERLSWEHAEAPVQLVIFQTNSQTGKCAASLFAKIVSTSFM